MIPKNADDFFDRNCEAIKKALESLGGSAPTRRPKEERMNGSAIDHKRSTENAARQWYLRGFEDAMKLLPNPSVAVTPPTIKIDISDFRPLRWRTGLPLGNDKELTEDVLISWQGNWMNHATHCIGYKGDHPVTDDVAWVRYIPLSEILDLIGE